MKSLRAIFLSLIALVAIANAGTISQEQDDPDPARAAAVIREAIKARGGDAYTKVTNTVSQGQFTPFEKGISLLPQSFVDYIVYPDRERTDFGKGDTKFVQSNSGNTGWIYDANQKAIRDQTDEQIKNFQQTMRYDPDNLLRRAWQEPGAKLVYLGRREAWRNTFSEAVRIDFADGASATLHFDMRTKLPMMSEYKTVNGEVTTNNQARFFRWVRFGGVLYPTILDFYREGIQTGRASFDTVSINVNIPEKVFAKPSNVKEVK
ncbi:MAG TPA: hypothetical protein VF131_24265 [Blastocatellia bacterium]|nr:hypothetical protein [Blastocatellia bacterium]